MAHETLEISCQHATQKREDSWSSTRASNRGVPAFKVEALRRRCWWITGSPLGNRTST